MLIQLKNRVVLLEAISYASIEFPSEDTENDWIELILIVDGQDVVLTGDDALCIWQLITQNATSVVPAPLKGLPLPQPLTVDDMIADAHRRPFH